jgi:hypothetical protein
MVKSENIDYGAKADLIYNTVQDVRSGVEDVMLSWRTAVKAAQAKGDFSPKTSEILFTEKINEYVIDTFAGGKLPDDEQMAEVTLAQLRNILGYDRLLPFIHGKVYDETIGGHVEGNLLSIAGRTVGSNLAMDLKRQAELDPDNIIEFQKYFDQHAKENNRSVEAEYKHLGDKIGDLLDMDDGPLVWERPRLKEDRLRSKHNLEKKVA